jgi:hypothetical protein
VGSVSGRIAVLSDSLYVETFVVLTESENTFESESVIGSDTDPFLLLIRKTLRATDARRNAVSIMETTEKI